MPRRHPNAVPGWAIGLLAVVATVTVVVIGLAWTGDSTRAVPRPPATAPPDTGLAVPALDPADPGAHAALLAEWTDGLAGRTEIPRPALMAYGNAAARTAVESPDCGLSWTVLAGIGAIESAHGRFGGATLGPDGRSDPVIRGLPLDGRPGILEIRDTDGGVLDGDVVYDRAMGPMQFIPTTWELMGADGDGDGRADPDDLDDAALAAARYLCTSATELVSADGWWSAVLTYNRSAEYGRDVLEQADGYGRASRAA